MDYASSSGMPPGEVKPLPIDDTGFATMAAEIGVVLVVELLLTIVFGIGFPLTALGLHFAFCAAYWRLFARHTSRSGWRRETLRKLLALSIVGLGPFGAAGTLLSLVRLRLRQSSFTPFEEWYETLFPTSTITRPDFLHRLLIRSGDAVTGNVSPFADIMEGLDDTRKQAVLALVTEYFIPEYVPALKRGLIDHDPTIRVSAATVMASIEGKYLTRGVSLENYVSREPGNMAARRALAEHLDEYAHSGLVEPARAAEMSDRAIQLYRECIGDDPEVENRLGRMLVRLGRLDDADKVYDRLLANNPDYLPALPWEIEILYRQGRFAALRHLARSSGRLLLERGAMPAAIRDAIEEWEAKEES
jgi:hypothetical protein